jgi:hypothetical protein
VPGHSKARQYCLARQYSGHDASPADCKVPWQPKTAQERIWTSDPPSLTGMCPAHTDYNSRPGLFYGFRLASVPLCTGLEQLASSARASSVLKPSQ